METTEISLGISPCPNDTFIFYHLLNRQRLPFRVKLTMADVEQLNQMVIRGKIDVSKVSFALAAKVLDRYSILDSGSAIGRGCGPLILARQKLSRRMLQDAVIAIPGEHTTAAMLLNLYLGTKPRGKSMLFSEIPQAIAAGHVDAGCVIHETRFTYRDLGLVCVQDLGTWWEAKTGKPIPLGGIIASRALPADLVACMERGIRESMEFAARHPGEVADFVSRHAQEISSEVQEQHIKLYVNEFSLSLGSEGREAIQTLFDLAESQGLLELGPGWNKKIFFQH